MTMRHNNREMITAEEAISYRLAIAVTESFKSRGGYEYPICPRCRITLEREYQAYCDRCGQALDWKKYGR
ncbi:MAG: hypothetical protein IJM98_09225 [Oscillospiraceae bacterium]|nr:hypothetical protein [Oscillospiraceae bacterium]